jgi:hypothetical protein
LGEVVRRAHRDEREGQARGSGRCGCRSDAAVPAGDYQPLGAGPGRDLRLVHPEQLDLGAERTQALGDGVGIAGPRVRVGDERDA